MSIILIGMTSHVNVFLKNSLNIQNLNGSLITIIEIELTQIKKNYNDYINKKYK